MNTENQSKKFYNAVDDVTHYIGTKNSMQRLWANADKEIFLSDLTKEELKNWKFPEYDFRIFGEKFVDNKVTAILNVVYFDHNVSNNPEVQFDFFKRLKFNPETNCYIFDEYLTTGLHLPPKQIHWEQFQKGKFKLELVRHEIQIFSTNIENIPLDAIKAEIYKTEKGIESKDCCDCDECKCCKMKCKNYKV